MTVRIYRSTDASAPVLTGSAGALITVLDAILVNGYGALAAAGWTKAFSTTNKAAYKQNLTGANNASGMYLYVDDTAPVTAKEARVTGFETMSAITPTGTGQFPTLAQSAIGSVGALLLRKSTTADATARPWTCIANGQTIYFFTETGDTVTPLGASAFCFGDFKSYRSADSYAVMIIGRTVENTGSSICDPLHALNWTNSGTTTGLGTLFGHFIARHWTGTGGSIRAGKPTEWSRITNCASNTLFGSYGTESSIQSPGSNGINLAMGRNNTSIQWAAPNGPDGALALAPVRLCHHNAERGYLLGMWQPLHDRPLGHNDTFSVTGGNLNGKSFIAQAIQAYIAVVANADSGQCIVETSDTWG